MKPLHLAAAAAAAALALAACGDDTATSAGSGGGATSTSAASTGTVATSTVSSGSQGSGGDGAGTPSSVGSGGGEGGQGGQGGEGGAGPSQLGGPCEEDGDCVDGLCLTEVDTGAPGGQCARRCDPTQPDDGCPEGLCESRSSLGDVCIASCDPAAPACRDAYHCEPRGDASTDWACRAQCTSGDDCPVTGNCASGRCLLPESNCTDLVDSDRDQLWDCSDPDCLSDPACVGGDGELGDPCEEHTDCALGTYCFREEASGWPHGACIVSPGEDMACPEGTSRFQVYFIGPPYELTTGCSTTCAAVDECRDGYQCAGACQGRCESGDQCASGACWEGDRKCYPAEVCDDGIDNDKGGYVDCFDPACTEACADALAAECAAAIPLPEEGEFATEVGQQSGGCGGPGSETDFYVFTADVAGTLLVTIDAATPHWLGTYTECDLAEDLNCSNNASPFDDGVVTREMNLGPGVTRWISVSSNATHAGPYTLSSTFTPD
jgi:hypothetical protein